LELNATRTFETSASPSQQRGDLNTATNYG
jgi:hypothetical protein